MRIIVAMLAVGKLQNLVKSRPRVAASKTDKIKLVRDRCCYHWSRAFSFGGSSSMRYIREGDKKVIEYKSRLYTVWAGMKQRCFNPNNDCFPSYGGRGITVCPIWAKRNGYHEFIDWANTDNIWWYFGKGQRRYNPTAPNGACTLDRVDNDGPYTPINCRWVDQKTQANNTRKTKARLSKVRPKRVYSFKELHPQARTVIVMDVNGNEISRFEGIRQAAIALFGDTTKQAAIRYAATRSQKGTYRGYRFKILD